MLVFVLVAFLLVVVDPPLTLLLPLPLPTDDAAVANVEAAEALVIMETNFSINSNAL